jgi:uncharacterized membrane protein
MDTASLLLATAYWLHMLATVAWIGSLAALALVVIPAARKALDPLLYSALLLQIQTRLQPVGWFSLAVLGVTGMFQMSAHPSYEGFLAISNPWAVAILVKHLAISLLVLSSAAMTWGVLPALQRAALLRAAGKQVEEAGFMRIVRRENRLLVVNLLLSLLVLALTAWARAAG